MCSTFSPCRQILLSLSFGSLSLGEPRSHIGYRRRRRTSKPELVGVDQSSKTVGRKPGTVSNLSWITFFIILLKANCGRVNALRLQDFTHSRLDRAFLDLPLFQYNLLLRTRSVGMQTSGRKSNGHRRPKMALRLFYQTSRIYRRTEARQRKAIDVG